jgi:tRNA threonylcarbamoyl adenosine modification protein (Sua5/YciO/YrdC/YwlC family)
MTQRIACADGAHRERAVAAALAAVRRGDVVVVPTESVYAIATDAFSPRGTAAMRDLKGYPDDAPLPVMVGSWTTVSGIAARVSDDARALMEAFWPGELTLLLAPQPTLAWDLPPDTPLAVRMPLHPVTLALLARSGPLAVTSANMPGLAAPVDVDDALEQLGGGPALALDAGRLADDGTPVLPSTIVDLTTSVPRLLRAGALSAERIQRVCPHTDLGERPDPA